MYFPYFRGKQYELVAIREYASRIAPLVVPIMEPVRSSLSGLERAVRTCCPVMFGTRSSQRAATGTLKRMVVPALNGYGKDGSSAHSVANAASGPPRARSRRVTAPNSVNCTRYPVSRPFTCTVSHSPARAPSSTSDAGSSR